MTTRKTVAQVALRRARRSRDLTQSEVALATGIDRTRISLFEAGYAQPSKTQRAALAKFFKVPAAQLFDAEAV